MIRSDVRHLSSSLLYDFPRAEIPNVWKIFPQQEHLYAGTRCSQLCSLLWKGFPHLPVVKLLLIDNVWAGHAFFLELLSLSPVFLILNPLKSKFVAKFLIAGLWPKYKKLYFVVVILILAFLLDSHRYFEPFICLNKGSHSLLRTGNCIPLTWLLGTLPAFSFRFFWENDRNDYSIFLSVSDRGQVASAENSRNILPLWAMGRRQWHRHHLGGWESDFVLSRIEKLWTCMVYSQILSYENPAQAMTATGSSDWLRTSSPSVR